MKENNMLKTKPSKSERMFVKYRKVLPNGPLEVLEMDIKFVWVEEDQRHAYVLTVIDPLRVWHFITQFNTPSPRTQSKELGSMLSLSIYNPMTA
ncbi:hypothetical protein MASR2M117_05400 [Paludibacter sp.]